MSANSADPPNIFEEDLVFLNDDPNSFAVVTKVAWQNDELTDVDDDDEPFTEPHQIKLSWALDDDTGLEENHVLSLEAAAAVTVLDRAFQPGDVVTSAAQSGTVSAVDLQLDLALYGSPLDDLASKKITSKYGPKKAREVTVFHELSSRDARPITIESSSHVALSHQGSNWVGKIDGTMSHVEVQFVEGSRALSRNATVDLVTPVNDQSVNWRALWLQFKKFKPHVTGEIHAEIDETHASDTESESRDSASDVSDDDVSDDVSDYDSDASWDAEIYAQIVDCVDYHVGQVVELSQGLLQASHVPDELYEASAEYLEGNFVPRAHKYGLVTRVVPMWAAVTWLAAQQLSPDSEHVLTPPRHAPISSLHVLQYSQPYTWQLGDWCQFPTSKLGNNVPPAYAAQPTVTARVIRTRTYVDVKWQDGSMSQHVDSTTLKSRDHLLECDFQPDDFVTREDVTGVIQSVAAAKQTAWVTWLNSDLSEPAEHEPEEVSIYDLRAHPDFNFQLGDVVLRLPAQHESTLTAHEWLGEVTALQGPRVQVQWTSGVSSTMRPNELFVLVDEYAEEDSEDSEDSEASEDAESGDEAGSEHGAEAASEGLLWTALTKLQQWLHPTSAPVTASVSESAPLPDTTEGPFEVLEEVAQHHYLARTHTNTSSAFCNLVMKEWTTLQQNLTPGIHVKVFEGRIDLLKVLIVGPQDTPYYQSLFVFDICLPEQYPHVPPLVHYWSKVSQKLHPNLNTDGGVCLSLLGTWITKSSTEDWNPDSSTLLQLLLSLQGLVLGVGEPYYLEAGYDKLRGTSDGAHQSRIYNERALILSVQAMAETLQGTRLPLAEQVHAEFTPFIVRHFATHGHAIVESLRQLYLTPSTDEPGAQSPYAAPTSPAPSDGFVLALKSAVLKLSTLLE